jgi:predicted pyridoxine 5'-phosphate oxidase superfamily flavin-nucleotide-binding protein
MTCAARASGREGSPALIELTDDMKQSLNNALTDRSPVTVAYVDPDGQPSISFRGTVQALSDDQLAMWARDPEGGILRGIAVNPKLALMYRNMAERKGWQFQGRARVETDASIRDQIFDNSPQVEQGRDPDRKGVAIIIDLDRVTGRDVNMER